jgi:hypothetical protein
LEALGFFIDFVFGIRLWICILESLNIIRNQLKACSFDTIHLISKSLPPTVCLLVRKFDIVINSSPLLNLLYAKLSVACKIALEFIRNIPFRPLALKFLVCLWRTSVSSKGGDSNTPFTLKLCNSNMEVADIFSLARQSHKRLIRIADCSPRLLAVQYIDLDVAFGILDILPLSV